MSLRQTAVIMLHQTVKIFKSRIQRPLKRNNIEGSLPFAQPLLQFPAGIPALRDAPEGRPGLLPADVPHLHTGVSLVRALQVRVEKSQGVVHHAVDVGVSL